MSWSEALVPEVLPFYVATLAMLALAAFLVVAGKGPPTRALSAYLILFGVANSMETAAPHVSGELGRALASTSVVFLLPVGLPLLWLASTWPAPRGPLARIPHAPWLLAGVGVAIVVAAVLWPRLLVTHTESNFFFASGGPLITIALASVATPGVVAWVLSRDLASAPAADVRSRRLLAIAFTFFPIWRGVLAFWIVKTQYLDFTPDQGRIWFLLGEGLIVVSMLLGLDSARRIVLDGRRRSGRFPVGVAGLLASAVALSLLLVVSSTKGPTSVWPTITFTLCQLVLPVVATYGLLRGGILGLDLKIRFAISKSTIAAIFITVFFLASETAQQFFGDRFESGYLGILAAGALVFAIAPLSRVADRLAEKAVPVTAAPAGMPSRKEATYRDALAVAMRDRKLTPAEEVTLARLAEDLGIGAGRAMELRLDVDAERKGRGR